MKVSVIIPIYNVSRQIVGTLDSVLGQRMQDFEIILVDDHGHDDSMQVATDYLRDKQVSCQFLSTPCNSGPGIARNVGIEAARGEYVAFLDGDDLWHEDFLQLLLESAERHTTDLCYCQITYQGGGRDGVVRRNPVLPAGELTASSRKGFIRRFVTFSVCFLYRREFLLQNELRFPEGRNSEDTNFLTRCLLLADRVTCVDQPLYVYCLQEGSLSTGRNSGKWKNRIQAMNRLMASYRQLMADPRHKHRRLQQYRGVMTLLYLKKGVGMALKDIVEYWLHL